MDAEDTALTLNLKCLEACMTSFQSLVSDIMADQVTRKGQHLGERSYFGLYDLPPNLGILDFSSDSKRILDTVRALDFGLHDNQLGTAKIWTSTGDFLLVTKAERMECQDFLAENGVLQGEHSASGGLVSQVFDGEIFVTTRDVTIKMAISDVTGSMMTSEQLRWSGVQKGACLRGPDKIQSNAMDVVTQCRKKETFWRRKLTNYDPTIFYIQKMHFASHLSRQKPNVDTKVATYDLPQMSKDKCIHSHEDVIAASFIHFLCRVCCTSNLHVGLLANKIGLPAQVGACYSSIVPAIFDLDFSAEAVDVIASTVKLLKQYRNGKTFLTDIFHRYPQLHNTKTTPFHNIVLLADNERGVVDYEHILKDCRLAVNLRSDDIQIAYTEDQVDSHVIDVLSHYPKFLKSLISSDETCSILDVSLLSARELGDLYPQPEQRSDEAGGASEDLLDNFWRLIETQPHCLALSSTSGSLTYLELERQVTRLAAMMHKLLPSDTLVEKPCIGKYLSTLVCHKI